MISLLYMALELKCIVEAKLIKVSQYCMIHYFQFNSHLKWLCISSKAQHYSYKGECCVCGHMYIEAFKRRSGLSYR